MKTKLLKRLLLTVTIIFTGFNLVSAQDGVPDVWDFDTTNQNWVAGGNITTATNDPLTHDETIGVNGGIKFTRTTNNANIKLGGGETVDATLYNHIKIVMKNKSPATEFRVILTGQASTGIGVSRKDFVGALTPNSDEFITYYFDLSTGLTQWDSNAEPIVLYFRRDIGTGTSEEIEIDSIEFLNFIPNTTVDGFVHNPSFDDGLGNDTSWKESTKDFADASILNSPGGPNVRTGAQSLQIAYAQTFTDPLATYFMFNDERINYGPTLYSDGSTLNASVWVKSNVAGAFEVSATFVLRDPATYDGTGASEIKKTVAVMTPADTSTDWVQLNFPLTINDGTQFTHVGFWFAITATVPLSYSDIVYFDDWTSTFNGVVLSIDDITKDDASLKLFPNPVRDILRIKSDNSRAISKIEIYSLLGKRVLSTEQTESINVSALSPGVYVSKIYGDKDSVSTKRFIKE